MNDARESGRTKEETTVNDAREKGPVGILCAGDDEVAPFLPMLEGAETTEKAMLTFHRGRLCGSEAVTLYAGVGKVNAAIAAQILIDTFRCRLLVNAGTAGGIDPSVRLLDTVVATKAAYGDMDEDILTEFHPFLPSVWLDADEGLLDAAKRAAAGRRDVRFGPVVTGDRFIDGGSRDGLLRRYAPLCADMEAASAAHVCHVNRIPFIAVKTITDTASHGGKENFELHCRQASRIAANFVRGLLAILQGGP